MNGCNTLPTQVHSKRWVVPYATIGHRGSLCCLESIIAYSCIITLCSNRIMKNKETFYKDKFIITSHFNKMTVRQYTRIILYQK